MERKQCLSKLVALSGDIAEIREALRQYAWDSERALVVLDPDDIVSVLRRFIQSEITKHEVEQWADAIEGRDDIGYAPTPDRFVQTIIFELASPEISAPLDIGRAESMIEAIGRRWPGRAT